MIRFRFWPGHEWPEAEMIEVDTPPEKGAANWAHLERFRKNSDWYQAHLLEIVAAHQGRHVCVAGQELFVADSVAEVMALARAAHPEDDAGYLHYVRREQPPGPRVTVHRLYRVSEDGVLHQTGEVTMVR